jgi:hypothetical protein
MVVTNICCFSGYLQAFSGIIELHCWWNNKEWQEKPDGVYNFT